MVNYHKMSNFAFNLRAHVRVRTYKNVYAIANSKKTINKNNKTVAKSTKSIFPKNNLFLTDIERKNNYSP